MRPEEIEEMLFQRAVRSKIRPPLTRRISNLALGRAVAATAVAGTALLCTLALNSTDSPSPRTSPNASVKPLHPLMTDTNQHNPPGSAEPDQLENTDPITASVAMSR